MVLVDTSVWVSHLRDGNEGLAELLDAGEVLCHPMIVGELACGHLKDRSVLLSCLEHLPAGSEAGHDEVLSFIERRRLMGRGIGYIDVHLLLSALLSDAWIWTLDRNLARAAASLGIGRPGF
jgi:predicted nucleic acid-binding protein